MYVIESKRVSWWRVVTTLSGTTLPTIWPRLLVVTLVALAITLVHEHLWRFHTSMSVVPFTLVGLPLGISLGFRNSASYERFNDGRKLWGGLVNTSRTWARLVLTVVGPQREGVSVAADADEKLELAETRRRLVHRQIAYVHALRMHLRAEDPTVLMQELLGHDEAASLKGERNVPAALVQHMGEDLRAQWARGWVHPLHLPLLDAPLTELMNIQGGCERIKSTPVPFSYIVLLHRIVAIYCLLLPLGVIDSLHWSTVPVTVFVSYALFGLDAIGDELEDPFGKDPNDLPLTALCRTIEINLRQRLGERDLPAPLKPVEHILE